MSRYSTPFCSDEELLVELNKLGYDEVPPDVFERMKDDLSELVAKEQDDLSSIVENEHDLPLSEYGYNDKSQQSSNYLSTTGEWRTAQVENYKKTDSHVSRKTKKKSRKTNLCPLNDNDEVFAIKSRRFQNADNGLEIKSFHASSEYNNINDEDVLSELGNSQDKRAKVNKLKPNQVYGTRNSKIDHNRTEDDRHSSISKKLSPKEDNFDFDYASKYVDSRSGVLDSSGAKFKSKASKESKLTKSSEKIQQMPDAENSINDSTLEGLNDAFKVFNLDENYYDAKEPVLKNSDGNLNSSSSTNSEKKTIKRKVLRRRNGRSVITEELVEIPSIFDTSYPESENLNSSKSLSSDDLTYKSNSSSGSVTVLSPESSIKSSPSTFSLSSRSTSLRISNTRKKKSDPVAMYNYYKKFWDSFKPPGENTRDRLRWAVRDKMLEYHI